MVDVPLKVLALSGSLRLASSNSVLLRAAQRVALTPSNVDLQDVSTRTQADLALPAFTFEISDRIRTLPLFSPDLEDEPPQEVITWRQELAEAMAIFISTPEYAHGLPGALKNALDWIVSSGEWMHKPFALLNASPRSTFAQAQLLETLKVMMAIHVPEADATIPLLGKSPSGDPPEPETVLAMPGVQGQLNTSIRTLISYANHTNWSV